MVLFLKVSHFWSRALARCSCTLVFLSYLLARSGHSHIAWYASYLDDLLVWKIRLISLIFIGPYSIKSCSVVYFSSFPYSVFGLMAQKFIIIMGMCFTRRPFQYLTWLSSSKHPWWALHDLQTHWITDFSGFVFMESGCMHGGIWLWFWLYSNK